MKRLATAAVLALAAVLPAAAQPVTGLSGWSLVLDPGHSEQQNQGAFGYSEAEKVLAVGLEIRRLFQGLTDVDTVYMTRTSSVGEVSLQQRVDYANLVGAAYFHSIHSNAAGPDANSLFVLWPQDPATLGEPPAAGGRATAKAMGPTLARAMRIPRAGTGDYGECDFYGVSTCRTLATAPKASRNFVQSFTVMPSTLSEAGFHTNPTQNQRNMNADWKRLEARAMFWSFLKVRGAARPASRIVTGIVTDVESGLPLNGATVAGGGRGYTTDTYATLFNRFTTDPNLLRNGFYYLEDVPAGPFDVTASAVGYGTRTVSVAPVDTFFTYADIGLVSAALLRVASTTPANAATAFRVVDPVDLTFSRPVDVASVQGAFALVKASGGAPVAGAFVWSAGNRVLRFTPAAPLDPFTEYVLTVGAAATSPYGYALDGNGDGTAGDGFTLRFTTGPQDVTAPAIVATYPRNNAQGTELDPLVALTFDEVLDPASVQPGLFTLARTDGTGAVPVTLQRADVGGQTVVHAAPTAALQANTFYRLAVAPGLRDAAGNAVTVTRQVTFRTGALTQTATTLDAFEGAFTDNWWQPTQSGSTVQTSIDIDSTKMDALAFGNPLTGSARSMRVQYGWRRKASSWLIRQYLNAGPAFNARFDTSYTLQTYVFGDGKGTQFRFAVDDGCNPTCASTEVSPWTTVDWKGWRLVSWDLGSTPAGSWIGNGVVEGGLRFDSYQLGFDSTKTLDPAAVVYGRLLFDDLRVVRLASAVGVDDAGARPDALALLPPTPNPTRAATAVRFRLPEAGRVALRVFDATGRAVATLADGDRPAGDHTVRFDPAGLAAGVYFLRLDAAGRTLTRPVVVAR